VNDRRRNSIQMILYPLGVMLLLTVLVGTTAFQVANTWRQTALNVAQHATQAVLLTNIRWTLEKVRREAVENPETAMTTWHSVQEQVNLLAQSSPERADFRLLQTYVAKDDNMRQANLLLKRDILNVRLAEVRDELDGLGAYSQFVTVAVTVAMLGLGGILMGITALDLSKLVRALVRSRDLNIRVQEEERRRIAQDLHDGVVQELVDLKRHYSPEKVDAIISNLRRVCHNLKPQVLEDLGLASALEFLGDELRQTEIVQVQVQLDADGIARLPKRYELPLFRVIQELLSNIKRHAQATQVTLTVVYNPEESHTLRAYVSDNGCGFVPGEQSGSGMGLTGVRERIQQLDGQLHIESQPGKGTRFQIQIPIHETAEPREVRHGLLG
jgi:two-component system sensor histidine kinase DegS